MEFLPCPFCGSIPVATYRGSEFGKKRSITVKCRNCRIERTDATLQFGFDYLERLVVENWNNRPGMDAENWSLLYFDMHRSP